MNYHARLRTPFGVLGISCTADALTGIAFLEPGVAPIEPRAALAREICRQVTAYLDDPDFRFDLPLAYDGTAHQRRVWQAMCAIPRGRVRTYGDVAAELGSSALAVGQACGANPLPLVISCHRIVSKSGIGGFANHSDGYFTEIKRWLLAREGAL